MKPAKKNRAWQSLSQGLVCLGIILLLFFPTPLSAKISIKAKNKAVILSWNKPTTRTSGAQLFPHQITGYHIFRSAKKGAEYSRITLNPIQKTAYIDHEVINNTTYYYVLTTVDTEGVSSSYSKEIAATPEFHPPSGFKATSGKQMITLSWNKYESGEIRGYSIYRSDHPSGPYKTIASQQDTSSSYYDRDLISGKNYCNRSRG